MATLKRTILTVKQRTTSYIASLGNLQASAEDYAANDRGVVALDGAGDATTNYSAKAYSLEAKDWATAAGDITKANNTADTSGSAKAWATRTDAAVDGSGYSSKEWAVGTQTRGASGGGSAKDWATRTGATVDDTGYSAREWAVGTTVAAGSAKDWATAAEDADVSGAGEYSARHWALKALANAAVSTVSGASPSFTMTNTSASNADGARATVSYYKGTRADATVDTLASVTVCHKGTSADSRGIYKIAVNEGAGLVDRFWIRNGGAVGSGVQYLFMDPAVWLAGNAGASSYDDANNFHYYDTGALRVEFESEDNVMQFYIEGGPGYDAWYGLQEGSTHHWSIGQRATESGALVWSNGFGLTTAPRAYMKTTGELRLGNGMTAPDASARLEVASTTKGFLPPRMTTSQRTAVASAATGLEVFDTDVGRPFVKLASAWAKVLVDDGGDLGFGSASSITPGARFTFRESWNANAHVNSHRTFLLESNADALLQIAGDNTGTVGTGVILSNSAGASDGRHWVVQHRGASSSNVFAVGYATTTATGTNIPATVTDYLTISTAGAVTLTGTLDMTGAAVIRGATLVVGHTTPLATLHARKTALTGLHQPIAAQQGCLLESTAASVLQIAADNGGTAAAGIIMTNQESASDGRHWVVQHRGASSSNVFAVGYDTTTATGDNILDGTTDYLTISTAGVVHVNGTLGVGTSSLHSSVLVGLTSTTRGFRMPVMTSAQRLAIATPTDGLAVFDSDLHRPIYYDAGASLWGRVLMDEGPGTNLGIGTGSTAPKAALHLQCAVSALTVHQSISAHKQVLLQNNGDFMLQVAGDNTGSVSTAIVLTNMASSSDGRHWSVQHRGTSDSNSLRFGYVTSAADGDNLLASPTFALTLTTAGSVIVGALAALATTATAGFLYVPTSAGTPTGVPNSHTGKVALEYDTSNNRLYVYNGGWKYAALT